jgi:hypothetical protein
MSVWAAAPHNDNLLLAGRRAPREEQTRHQQHKDDRNNRSFYLAQRDARAMRCSYHPKLNLPLEIEEEMMTDSYKDEARTRETYRASARTGEGSVSPRAGANTKQAQV